MGYILCTRVATYIWINHKSKFSILCFLPVKFFVSNSHCPYGYIWILLTRRLSCICKRGELSLGEGGGGQLSLGGGEIQLRGGATRLGGGEIQRKGRETQLRGG